jgi:integrase
VFRASDRQDSNRIIATDCRQPTAVTSPINGVIVRTPEIWTVHQLAHFLAQTTHLRLYPARHLAATTGLRRGELAGLRWGDWQRSSHRLSIARSRQSVQGKTVEVPTKTAAGRRCVDLDPDTEQVRERWRRQQCHDGPTRRLRRRDLHQHPWYARAP